MKKQCAAVSTHCAPMMVPPQMWMGPYCTLTCQGHLLTEVSFPPMIRPKILCPQAGGESEGLREGASPGGCVPEFPPSGARWPSRQRGSAILIPLHYPKIFLKNAPFAQPIAKTAGKRSPSICSALPALVRAPGRPARLLVHRRETYFPVRHWELRERRGGRGLSPSPSAALQHRGRAGAAHYLLRLCWMVSRSFVTVRLLPATCRGMYSVCDALGGERW